MIHSDHFCVVAILRLRAVRRLQKLNASLGHANREAERPVGARAVHRRGGPIFVHGFLEDYAVYAVLAKKKSLAIGMLIFLWMKHPHSACYFFCGACTQACRSSSRKKTARGSSSRCALAAEFFRTAPRDYPTTRVYDFFLRLRADVRVASPAALP